jgi:hypothetical protein
MTEYAQQTRGPAARDGPLLFGFYLKQNFVHIRSKARTVVAQRRLRQNSKQERSWIQKKLIKPIVSL